MREEAGQQAARKVRSKCSEVEGRDLEYGERAKRAAKMAIVL